MAAIVGILSRHALKMKYIVETNLIIVRYHCKPWIHFNSNLKQLFISDKMKHFNYKATCGVRGHTNTEMFKRRFGLCY